MEILSGWIEQAACEPYWLGVLVENLEQEIKISALKIQIEALVGGKPEITSLISVNEEELWM